MSLHLVEHFQHSCCQPPGGLDIPFFIEYLCHRQHRIELGAVQLMALLQMEPIAQVSNAAVEFTRPVRVDLDCQGGE